MTDAEILEKLVSKISKELHVEKEKVLPLLMVCAAFDENAVKNADPGGRMSKAIQMIVGDEDFMELRRRMHDYR